MWIRPDKVSLEIQVSDRQSILNHYPDTVQGALHLGRDVDTWMKAGVHPARISASRYSHTDQRVHTWRAG